MITNLLLKFSSKNKTSKLTLFRSSGKSAPRQAARHTTIDPGVYLFDKVIEVHESHPEVQGLIGKKVLMFRRQSSTDKVYIYAGPSNMMPLQNCIAVSVSDFMEITAGLTQFVTTLEVESTFMLWGAKPILEEAIPPSYRHLFRVRLDCFAEPSEEAKQREAKRRAEEQARRAAAEEREAARRRAESEERVAQARAAEARAAAARAQRDADAARQAAQVREQQRVAQERQRATGSSGRPVRSTTRHRDDDDTLGDFMFMSMFPDVAPMYRPNSFMAWYLWSQSQQDHQQNKFNGAGGQFDGGGASGNWEQGVPGFPEAASQRVSEYAGIKRVDLLDDNGRSIGSFTVTENNGQTQFSVTGGHVFTVAGESKPTIEYAADSGQRFFWDGENEPVVESPQDTRVDAPAASGHSFFDVSSSYQSSEDRSSASQPQNMESNTAY